jgi:hypothetical protein
MQEQLRIALADRIEAEFSGKKGHDDGRQRPKLERKDCEFIVSILLSEMTRTGLGVYDATSERGGNADRT